MHTLLLVDDDPDVLATLTRSFRKGYKTLSGTGGEEGIALLNEHPVDLIICDQRMPNISGDQVLSHALQVQPAAIRILLTGYADVESLMTCVNDAHIYKYVTKPWDPAELNLTVVRALESLVLKRDLDTARDQLETAYKDAVIMLCLAAEGKDQDTASHLYRVQHYTEALASSMGVDSGAAAHMGLMSMLHDIGKLATPDAILKKPDKLTEEEWVIMREHPLNGVRILGNNPFYETAREISAGHHENYDGTGYPYGLKGDNIPLSARIVKLADVLDALTTNRPYKKPWTMETAITHIESHTNIMFDPAVVVELKKLFVDGTLMRIMTTHYG
ncbi:MAG: HD domain-containing phosphohydrolase [Methylobacter sp.]|nr:HD domain-containing phosphohydrolase [Methylobacter sp.]